MPLNNVQNFGERVLIFAIKANKWSLLGMIGILATI
jgi:hypothetical protein